VLIVVALISVSVAVLSGSSWQDALLNFGTEMAGAAVTYALFERIIEGREQIEVEERELESRKAELITQMGSKVRDVAIPATEELRRRGWLQDGTLKRAYLVGASLQGAELAYADLREACLLRAKLQGAWLGHTKLQGADLERAKLQGANLEGAKLQGVDLREAEHNDDTIWPEGFTPPPEAIDVDAEREQNDL
jgi:uncharacterized protein YjbI with pentapeptide repeats